MAEFGDSHRGRIEADLISGELASFNLKAQITEEYVDVFITFSELMINTYEFESKNCSS
jgi:hypothetical protein